MAPTPSTAMAVAVNVFAGRMTSSPGPTPNPARARRRASVPDPNAATARPATASPNSASNASTSGPPMNRPERTTRRTASSTSWPISACSASGSNSVMRSEVSREMRGRAGLPATVVPGATSRVTTAPAPTMAPAPIVTPGRITAPLPIEARGSTTAGSRTQSSEPFVSPDSVVAAGRRSFVKLTWWPTKTSSPIVVPAQTKVCDSILQRRPIRTPC